MSAPKKIRLTDHFRAALKPRDLNQINLKQQQQQLQQQQQQQPGKAQQQELQKRLSHQPEPQVVVQPENRQARKSNVGPTERQQTTTSRKSLANTTNNTTNVVIPEESEQQHTFRKIALPARDSQNLGQAKQPTLQALLRYQEPASIYWEPHYAAESFEYDRLQEVKYSAQYQAHRKVDLVDAEDCGPGELLLAGTVAPRRAELVDWLVDIQMRFSLDHEPLYMAIKLADNYLARKFVAQDQLVLLFVASILVAAKYDERVPPLVISDLIHLARSKYGVKFTRKQVISLEVDLLNTLNFDIRYPLSYGFLRRFARCMRSDMRTIHLARYILESSLMDFDMIEILDSKIAAGSLLLAFEMLQLGPGAWNEAARYHTGYHEDELYPLVIRLNRLLVKLQRKKTAIRRKYSHDSFMEVARIPPLLPKVLLELTRQPCR